MDRFGEVFSGDMVTFTDDFLDHPNPLITEITPGTQPHDLTGRLGAIVYNKFGGAFGGRWVITNQTSDGWLAYRLPEKP